MKIKACGEEEFRCESGLCIPLKWQCDGEIDCPGGLDEWDQICGEFNIFLSRPLSHVITSMSQKPIKKKDATSAHLNVKQMELVCQESGGTYRKMR